MKKILILLLSISAFTSCKNESKNPVSEDLIETNKSIENQEIAYNFGEAQVFKGMFHNPSSYTDLFYADCNDKTLGYLIPIFENGLDDFFKPLKKKFPDDYSSFESVYVEFKGSIRETKETVEKGEFYNIMISDIRLMDTNKKCK